MLYGKVGLILLLANSAAVAQTSDMRFCDEVKPPTRMDEPFVCILRDPGIRLIPKPGEPTISNSPAPKCDEGYELVLSQAMRPMCARDLREPK